MGLFTASMLPVYLLGNFHCIGMCGPLVMMIGKHPYRMLYFVGRAVSFSLMAGLAGALGATLYHLFDALQLSALVSLLFGVLFIAIGVGVLLGWRGPQFGAKANHMLSLLILKEQPLATFLFGFFTVLLPCGQTLIVFSACALYGDFFVGWMNGLIFALLTTPSLFLAMHAHKLMGLFRHHYNKSIALCSLLVGVLSLCRALAEFKIIPHLILNEEYHVMLF